MNTSFQRTIASDEWFTPKELIDSLGEFDLDPCAPMHPLWPTAKVMWNKVTDGLSMDWGGREYGSTLPIPNRLSRSSAKGLRITATASACFSEGRGIRYSRRLCSPVPMRFCSSERGLSSTALMVCKVQAVGAIRSCSPLARTTPRPCSIVGMKAYMFH